MLLRLIQFVVVPTIQETELMKVGLADKQSQQAAHEQHSVRMLAANLDLAAR